MIWLIAWSFPALAQDEGLLAAERARAFLSYGEVTEALGFARVAIKAQSNDPGIARVYLQTCDAAGMGPVCRAEIADLSEQGSLDLVSDWWGMEQGVLPEQPPTGEDWLAVAIRSGMSLEAGDCDAALNSVGKVNHPQLGRLELEIRLDCEDVRGAAARATELARAWPDAPDMLEPLFHSDDRRLEGTRRRLVRGWSAEFEHVVDPTWLWRVRAAVLPMEQSELLGSIDKQLKRLGEPQVVSRAPWRPIMVQAMARTLVLSRNPTLPEAGPAEMQSLALALTELLRDMGRIPEALKVYESARERHDSAALGMAHATQLIRARRYEEALPVAREALRLATGPAESDPARLKTMRWSSELARAHMVRGTALSGLGDIEGALQDFTVATLLAPTPEALSLRGMLQQQLAHKDQALVSAIVGGAMGSDSAFDQGLYQGPSVVEVVANALLDDAGALGLDEDLGLLPRVDLPMRPPRAGDPSPPWDVEVEGKPLSNEDLHGQVVALVFFASWCGPCRAELPEMDKLAGEFEAEQVPVTVLALSMDVSEEDYEEYLDELGAQHLQTARKPELAPTFGARAIPLTVIVGQSGTVQAVHNGFTGDTRAIERDIRALLEPSGR